MKNLIIAISLSLFIPIIACAEQAKKFGSFEVHYNAMSTDELQPEVAKSYKIDRSKNRGLVTISVLKKNNLGIAQPVKAGLDVHAVNLSSQLTNIDMREIQEGTAIYYIGEYRITAPETLKFSVSATPQGESQAHKFEFQQKFYP